MTKNANQRIPPCRAGKLRWRTPYDPPKTRGIGGWGLNYDTDID